MRTSFCFGCYLSPFVYHGMWGWLASNIEVYVLMGFSCVQIGEHRKAMSRVWRAVRVARSQRLENTRLSPSYLLNPKP